VASNERKNAPQAVWQRVNISDDEIARARDFSETSEEIKSLFNVTKKIPPEINPETLRISHSARAKAFFSITGQPDCADARRKPAIASIEIKRQFSAESSFAASFALQLFTRNTKACTGGEERRKKLEKSLL
jgi:hypothetical protein